MPFTGRGAPPGNDGIGNARSGGDDEIENAAQEQVERYPVSGTDVVSEADSLAEDAPDIDFLALIRTAEDQANLYQTQANRKAWSQSLRAFHNEHFLNSKYTRPDWRGRSKLFVPMTRGAVRKDNAAVAASLFNAQDAINCKAANESDDQQRASAAVLQQLVNYRTDIASGKASLPWFLVSMGARQNAVLTGICLSKQTWLTKYRKTGSEAVWDTDPESGEEVRKVRDVFGIETDRPDMQLIPPENFIIDPAADWTNPAQSSAYLILKWPMQLEDIYERQGAPVNPWKAVPAEVLKNSVESGKWDMAAIRRAREMGLDRLDETHTGTKFQIVWVYETYMRVAGEDWTFFSVNDKAFLTDPKPVREAYPEQMGERPLAFGYGALEAHRIYPMAPAEAWQPLQIEINDIRNLTLDSVRQNVMPITKIRRGRQVDLDQVKRRSSGSSIMVNEPDDVTFETPPQLPQGAIEMRRELGLEFDDLAGQQNYGSVETNNALGKTLGGLKLAAGAANAVQEFDIRVWIETWASTALTQLVRLEQYYESDPVILGICGDRAQLFQKYGVSQITDEMLEAPILVQVSVGLGAGDPQQRLAKFESAAQVVAPLLAQTKEFQSGQVEIDWEAICQEVFGAVGYKDGGKRFFKINQQPAQNPMQDLQVEKLKAEIEQRKRQGIGSLLGGLSQVAKVALGKKDLEAQTVDMILGHQHEAHSMGFEHGHKQNEQHLSALDHGHRHGMAISEHRRNLGNDAHQRAVAAQEAQAEEPNGGGSDEEGAAAPPQPQAAPSVAAPSPSQMGAQPGPPPPQPGPAPMAMPPQAAPGPAGPGPAGPGPGPGPIAAPAPPPNSHADQIRQLIQSGQAHFTFTRGPDGRISGLQVVPAPNPAPHP